MSRILFICTSNSDRSVAMENYFRITYPKHEYHSAGVNRYFTQQKGTHYLGIEDIEWADVMVFAEEIHKTVLERDFFEALRAKGVYSSIVLGLGDYQQGNINEDYLLKAEEKLRHILK